MRAANGVCSCLSHNLFMSFVEIKNASSKKVHQWRKACRDVKACRERERERMNILSFEKMISYILK